MIKSKHPRFTLVVASLGLSTLGGLAWMLWGVQTGSDADPTASVGELPRGRTMLEGRHEGELGPCSFAPGTRMAYDVEMVVDTAFDGSSVADRLPASSAAAGPQASATNHQEQFGWHVDLEALGTAPDGSSVLATRISDRGARRMSTQAPNLDQTFLMRLGSHCDVREFGWRTEGDLEASFQQQQLMVSLGWLAPRAGEPRWSGTLLDSVGELNVGFEREDDRILGRVARVGKMFGHGAKDDARLEVAKSVIEVEPRASEWFGSLSSDLSLELHMFGNAVGTITASTRASRVEPGSWHPTVAVDDGGWSWGLLLDEPIAGSKRGTKVSRLAGVPADEAVSRYLDMFEDPGRQHAKDMLTEWLQANPEGAFALVERLRDGRFADERVASGMVGALGMAQTPQAGEALVSIVGDHDFTGKQKIWASWALDAVESPTEAMVHAMAAVAEQDGLAPGLRSTMRLSLGSFAASNAERAPEVAAIAREQIAGWLANPPDDEALSTALLAAGNARHEDLLPAIAPYLEHHDPFIRKDSTRAIRGMPAREAYPLLTSRMADVEPAVRIAAMETILAVGRDGKIDLPESAMDIAIDRLDGGATNHERSTVYELLGHASKRGDENARAVLQERFRDALYADGGSKDDLRELGKHTNTRWTAQ